MCSMFCQVSEIICLHPLDYIFCGSHRVSLSHPISVYFIYVLGLGVCVSVCVYVVRCLYVCVRVFVSVCVHASVCV